MYSNIFHNIQVYMSYLDFYLIENIWSKHYRPIYAIQVTIQMLESDCCQTDKEIKRLKQLILRMYEFYLVL